ncbi:MAG: EamA family transporter RarD [Rhodobacteraceae bacterium]|nr:EamA family transporter RarD [Paracoccaceae bacterium]
MSDAGKGIVAMLAANLVWGLAPIYYKLLAHVPPLEVLAHRSLWSFVFFGLVLAAQGRLRDLLRALTAGRGVLRIALAAVAITINWGLFIWAIQTGRTVEASLGYYIFPLISVVFGMLFFHERLGRARLVAFALAALAVAILTWGLGAPPVVSVVLAIAFGIYSVMKKKSPLGPVVSVTAEVTLLLPLALFWLWGVHNLGWTGVSGRNLATFGSSSADSLMLALSGPLTAAPLILFSYASRRLRLSTVGLLQYVNPTLQFFVAVLVFAEPFTRWHGLAFPLIWLALAIYSVAAIRQDRSARRASTSSATVALTDTKLSSEVSAKPSATT